MDLTKESPMSSDPEVERCLHFIQELSGALSKDVAGLSADEWDRVSNCAPWRIRDLVAHIVASGEGFAASIRQALKGSQEQSISHAQRDRRQAELVAADPPTVAREIDKITADFTGLYDGLEEDGLSAIGFHRRGNREVRWFAAHRLAEVAFHSWDFQTSLGREPKLDEDVALLLLPTLVESNAPRTYAAGLSAEKGTGERYLLAVADHPDAQWVVTIDPDEMTAVRSDGPADLAISGTAAALALLVYGRYDLSSLFQSGAIRLEGDAMLADRFGSIYPRP
jgi:uncharacterized protein (TIGR03083 family)